MSLAPRRYWHELTTCDFETMDKDRTVVILPVAAIEQHGPHLPVYVDACINQGLLDLALTKMPGDMQALVLPMQAVGKSNEHLGFTGTLTLSAETLTRVCTEIGESVHRAGFRRLVLLNSHGGQPQIMDIVARDLRVRLGMFVVTVGWSRMGMPPDLFTKEELKHGIHGGAVETSLMLHLRPDLVKMEEALNFVSLSEEMEGEYRFLTPEGRVGFGWQTQDLNPHGACGDATAASAEKGALVADHAAARFVELVEEVARFPLECLKTKQFPKESD
ncbi:creatininase family protein [Telmatospirillum sp. J64-1]|uniref:creatininase family protein n=1 Tax=Telmatospirillum sp. J64-1 TaxID=2502183 RepID=UPI00115DD7D2|nr:creatininase family protein [Telmatospirillum sp. J64-1]